MEIKISRRLLDGVIATQVERQAAPVAQEAAEEGFERRRFDRPGPGDRLRGDGRGFWSQRRAARGRERS